MAKYNRILLKLSGESLMEPRIVSSRVADRSSG